MTLFQAIAPVSVNMAIQKLGGTAQFNHIAHALGWTPPGSACSPISSPPMCGSAQSWDDIPMETDCPVADSDLANLQPNTSTLFTNDTPSMAADSQAEGSDGAVPTCRQLCLGNGTFLNFTKEEVGDPPAISFANNISCLIQTWDDTSNDWNPNKCVLHIQGQPIALVYWRDVYIYGKKGQWKGIQNRWTDWQVCVLFINLTLTLTKLKISIFFSFPFSTLLRAIRNYHLMAFGTSFQSMEST
jgi:hypothetical protein